MASDFNVPNRRHLSKALVSMLKDATGCPVGFVDAPLDFDGQRVDPPYAVVHPYDIGRYFGPPFFTPEADASFGFLIDSVGLRGDQAEWMSDQVVEAIVGRNELGQFSRDLVVDGLTVMDRRISESPGPVRNSGKIFYVVDIFLISVTTS